MPDIHLLVVWLNILLCFIPILLFCVFVIRSYYVMYLIESGKRSIDLKTKKNIRTFIVIGSGGHTTEMLRLVKYLDSMKFYPRIYIMASSDTTSETKVKEMEEVAQIEDDCWYSNYKILKIPRSRSVGQTYFTSIFTTIYSFIWTVPVVYKEKPDLILCNGPGTCIPVCLIAFFMRVFWLSNNIIVFIESLCRVKTLSLSGKILIYFADEVVVQWTDLLSKYPRARYIGRL